jgi:hypothetical protein
MVIAPEELPTWVTAELGPNYITFSGTPEEEGTASIIVVGTNCRGKLTSGNYEITIST